MRTVIRPARADDLQTAQQLVVRSINDLTERHGFGPMATVRNPDFQLFSLKDDPGGLWVAEAEGEMLGCAFSWVCDDLWFLAELFVSPGQQGRGIGKDLLLRTLTHARQSGATNKALITFTFNTVSQGLYIRHGLFPRLPIYLFTVTRDVLMAHLEAEQLRYKEIERTASHQECLAAIDANALGISRAKHHDYLLGDSGMRGLLLYSGDECIGYAYVAPTGHIGPMAVTRLDVGHAAFKTALNLAVRIGATQISAFLPGANECALEIAVTHGMRIAFPMVLVSSCEFGDWRRYLPRNPGFM